MNSPKQQEENFSSELTSVKTHLERYVGVISLLVAADENNVIGKDNELPWYLPNDLRYFKNLTWAMPVVMGRKTFQSIGKALPGRKNIVLTRDKNTQIEGAIIVENIDEAVQVAQEDDVKELFIIGGAEVFSSTFEKANRIYMTRIHHHFEGDVFFPEINEQEWKLVNSHHCSPDVKNLYPHTFQVWERCTDKEVLDISV